MQSVLPKGILPKGVENIVNDYATPRYEKIFLNPNFKHEFEYGHAMTECWFDVSSIIVNADDDHAIIELTCPGEYPDDDKWYNSWCAMSYDEVDYYLDSDSECQGGFFEEGLYEKKKKEYGKGKPWKVIYSI